MVSAAFPDYSRKKNNHNQQSQQVFKCIKITIYDKTTKALLTFRGGQGTNWEKLCEEALTILGSLIKEHKQLFSPLQINRHHQLGSPPSKNSPGEQLWFDWRLFQQFTADLAPPAGLEFKATSRKIKVLFLVLLTNGEM